MGMTSPTVIAVVAIECDKAEPPPLSGGAMISSDTLRVNAVTPRISLDRIWQELTGAGVTTLPPYIKRSWVMLDGHTYVAQLRVGRDYRVSRIEHIPRPEVQADREIQQINAILSREIGWG
jgi:hypothetical protein